MLAGELCDPMDPDLVAGRIRARDLDAAAVLLRRSTQARIDQHLTASPPETRGHWGHRTACTARPRRPGQKTSCCR
ncbi:MAG: maltose acetyltransferase domain-containing protein [Gemmatimonadaceae bacterium]